MNLPENNTMDDVTHINYFVYNKYQRFTKRGKNLDDRLVCEIL